MGLAVTELAQGSATLARIAAAPGARTRRLRLRALLVASIALAAAGSARAQQIEQFLVGSGCGPWGITGGPDGNLWLTCGSSNQVKKISPAGSVLGTFTLPHPSSYPVGIATGPDGNLWFGEHNGNRMARMTTAGIITEFDLPSPGSGIVGVAPGSDGNVWFTEQQGHRVGSITPDGVVTEFSDPASPTMTPGLLALGPDGNLWVNEGAGNVIARVTPDGTFTDFTAPSATVNGGIANGADGFVWFVEDGAAKVARIRVDDGHIDEFGPFPSETSLSDVTLGPDGRIWVDGGSNSRVLRLHPSGVLQASFPVLNDAWNGIAGPDGNVWFVNGFADAVTRVDTATGFEDFPFPCTTTADGGDAVLALPDGSFWGTGQSDSPSRWVEYHPMPSLVAVNRFYIPTLRPDLPGFGMAVDASGALWFPNADANTIVRLSPTGSAQSFPIPTASSDPRDVALGPDGNVWFTENAGHQIGRVTPQGVMAEFVVPNNGKPVGITAGPDGNLWFTDQWNDAIGRITTAGNIAEYPSPLSFSPIWIAADASRIDFTDTTHHIEWMTADGSGSYLSTTFPAYGVAASDGEMWVGSPQYPQGELAEYSPETGGLTVRTPAVQLWHNLSASPVTGFWYGAAVGGATCDPSHPGVFGHLRREIFVDGFESSDLWRWSTRSF